MRIHLEFAGWMVVLLNGCPAQKGKTTGELMLRPKADSDEREAQEEGYWTQAKSKLIAMTI